MTCHIKAIFANKTLPTSPIRAEPRATTRKLPIVDARHVTAPSREIKTHYSYLHLGDDLNISGTFVKLGEFCSAEHAALSTGSRGKRMDALHQQGAALASIFAR